MHIRNRRRIERDALEHLMEGPDLESISRNSVELLQKGRNSQPEEFYHAQIK